MLYFDYYNRSDLQDMKTMLKWQAFRYDLEVKGKARQLGEKQLTIHANMQYKILPPYMTSDEEDLMVQQVQVGIMISLHTTF